MQERYAPRRRQNIKDKYKKDIKFKLKVRLSGRLNTALKRAITSPFQNSGKMAKTKELIGCDIDYLINHLEKKFKPKMTWDNYGPYWHVDHIIPFEYFDIKTLKGQKAACHYTNLQPLERTLNIRKSNKLIMPKKLSKIVRDNIIIPN